LTRTATGCVVECDALGEPDDGVFAGYVGGLLVFAH